MITIPFAAAIEITNLIRLFWDTRKIIRLHGLLSPYLPKRRTLIRVIGGAPNREDGLSCDPKQEMGIHYSLAV
jgi:hypothetical protein